MKRLLALLFFLASPAHAQENGQFISALPFATLPLAGNEFIPLVQNGATKKIDSNAFLFGPVCGIAQGCTGLSAVGPSGYCLVSTGTALIYAPCGNTPPTPGSFIVTQTQVIIQTQSGVGIVTEQ